MQQAKAPIIPLLFGYIPFLAFCIAISYFFPTNIILTLQWLGALFLIFLGFIFLWPIKISPPTTPQPSFNFWQRQILWFGLQLGFFFLLFALLSIQISFSKNNSTELIKSTTQFYLYSALFPWPFYILLALSFARQKKHSSQIRTALWPLFKNRVHTFFGTAIDFYIKQGLITIQAITLALFILYLLKQLDFLTSLQLTFNSPIAIFLASSIIFLLLRSEYWQRATRFFWGKRLNLAGFLLVYCLIVLIAFLGSMLILKFLNLYLSSLPSTHIFNWSPINSVNTGWLLFMLCWEILIAPLFAYWIGRLISHSSLRLSLLQGLIIPVIFIWLMLHPNWLFLLLSNRIINLILVIGSLLLTIFFFREPDVIHLVHLTSKNTKFRSNYLTLSSLRNIFLLIIAILLVLFFTGTPFMILYLCGLMFPVLGILSLACLGAYKA